MSDAEWRAWDLLVKGADAFAIAVMVGICLWLLWRSR